MHESACITFIVIFTLMQWKCMYKANLIKMTDEDIISAYTKSIDTFFHTINWHNIVKRYGHNLNEIIQQGISQKLMKFDYKKFKELRVKLQTSS